jgi:hypothetical protein
LVFLGELLSHISTNLLILVSKIVLCLGTCIFVRVPLWLPYYPFILILTIVLLNVEIDEGREKVDCLTYVLYVDN